jgi:glycosyltransferase involved in cell wall biosynthesis
MVLLAESTDVRSCAAGFVDWVGRQRIDIVVPGCEEFIHAAVPALERNVRVVTRCGSMTRHAYALTTANLERTQLVITQTPRQYEDLTRDWGVPPEKCATIPSGINEALFTFPAHRRSTERLRLIYVGRLEDADKGVMLLPEVTRRLEQGGLDFHLDVVGDGPDAGRLRSAFVRHEVAGLVTFHGRLPRAGIVERLRAAHLSLLPSRFEGLPWTLLESMSCGCVPIVSYIARVTDTVVEQGVNGFLCKVGSDAQFASAILSLASDRDRLAKMSQAARQEIEARFTASRMVESYDRALTNLLSSPPLNLSPVALCAIQVPRSICPTWRTSVPQPIKNLVRTWAARFQKSI